MSDSYSARDAGNVGVIYQVGPVLDECSLTQEAGSKNAFHKRLDGGILQSLKSNDFISLIFASIIRNIKIMKKIIRKCFYLR
jgi:hypothetical protein